MNQKAKQAVLRARTQLIVREPFFGHLALMLNMVETDKVPTCGVGGVNLYYNPKFVLEISEEELVGVMAHEVMHCVYSHFSRRGHRDHTKFNMACVKAGTMITMVDGSARKIESVFAGEQVSTPLGPANVLAVTTNKKPIVELSLDNGYKLCCTKDHKVLTDGGFVEAGSLIEGATVILGPSHGASAAQDSTHAYIDGNSRRIQMYMDASSVCIETPCASYPKVLFKPSARTNTEQPNTVAPCLPSRNYRWRGNNIIRQSYQSQESDLHSATYLNIKHQHRLGVLVGVSRVSRQARKNNAQSTLLLDLHSIRLQFGQLVDCDLSIFSDQETTSRVLTYLHRTEKSTTTALYNYAKDVVSIKDNQETKCARVKTITPSDQGKEAIVYDLTTDKHCYVANGIVTHNCDFRINDDLKKVPFQLPFKPATLAECMNAKPGEDFHLYDPQFKDMSTEEIYEKIPDPPKQPGGGVYIVVDIGGCGAVIDAGAGPGDPDSEGQGQGASAEQVAHEWQANVRMAISIARANNAGQTPGYLERLVTQLKRPKVSWRDLTAQFIDQSMTTDYSFRRPNRRYIHSGLILPGNVADALHEMVMFVDCSGSVSEDMITAFVSEVAGTLDSGTCDHLYVVYADAKVQVVDEYIPGDVVKAKCPDGGGTDFDDSFEWLAKNVPDAACVVYLTDMATCSFGKEPPCPVLWGAYTTEAQLAHISPPFGTVVHVDSPNY
jgi:predicted metal-dependent peptidase